MSSRTDSRRRFRARILFILLSVVAVLLFFVTRSNLDMFSSVRSAAEDPTSEAMNVLTYPVRGFENFMTELDDKYRAHEENIRLQSELSRLSDVEARANALEIKLVSFQKIFDADFTSEIPERRIVTRAVAENGGPFVRSFLINSGADRGIKVGHPVMTSQGLLGHVIRVGEKSARVLRLEDLNSRVPVMSVRNQSRAILTGDNTSAPTLSFTTEGANWEDNDLIVTSGDDGVIPTGLPVGRVKYDKEGDIRVSLHTQGKHIDWVWIYPTETILTPEEAPTVDGALDAGDGSAIADPTLNASTTSTPMTSQPMTGQEVTNAESSNSVSGNPVSGNPVSGNPESRDSDNEGALAPQSPAIAVSSDAENGSGPE